MEIQKAKKGKSRGKPFYPGDPRTGRKKGTKNKYTNLKDAFMQVFDRLGGVDGLYQWVDENKRNKAVFYSMITKLFPIGIDPQANEIKITLKKIIIDKQVTPNE